MNAKKFNELLISLDACEEARDWAKGKDWKTVYETCHRGDWLLWLFYRVNEGDKRIFLAKAHCANTVKHLMKDKRSIKAIDAAIKYANGEITEEERKNAADADAAYAAAAADADAAYAAAAAAAYAAAAYAADADAAYADAAAAAYAADAAQKKNRQETADICRKYLPFEIWNINK